MARQKKATHSLVGLNCGPESKVLVVERRALFEPRVQGSNPRALQETNNSFFSAANKTLTTNHYFSLMDNDVQSLSLHYVYHRRELHILSITKTQNILFPPKVFIRGTMGQNLKVGLTGGCGYENRRPPVAKIFAILDTLANKVKASIVMTSVVQSATRKIGLR